MPGRLTIRSCLHFLLHTRSGSRSYLHAWQIGRRMALSTKFYHIPTTFCFLPSAKIVKDSKEQAWSLGVSVVFRKLVLEFGDRSEAAKIFQAPEAMLTKFPRPKQDLDLCLAVLPISTVFMQTLLLQQAFSTQVNKYHVLKICLSQWYLPVSPGLRRLRQEDHEFNASFGYMTNFRLVWVI